MQLDLILMIGNGLNLYLYQLQIGLELKMLGLSTIKRFMRLPSFVGLVGGKPNFAYYFCGYVEQPTELNLEPLN